MSWLAVGGASHLLMDFLDDIVGGLHYTGYVFSAWFTWPLLNPDLFPIRVVPLFCETPMHGLYTVAEAFAVALVLNRAAQELPSDQSQIRG